MAYASKYEQYLGNYLGAGGTGGKQYDFLTNYLKNTIEGGSPSLDLQRQVSTSNINKSYDEAQQNLAESTAGKGTFGSGVAASSMVGLEGQRGASLASNEANLAAINEQAIQQAVGRLIGVNEGQANRELSLYGTNVGTTLSREQLREQLKTQENAAQSSFLAQLLGAATQIGTAALI